MSVISDTVLIFRRQLRLSLRNPVWVVIGLVQPVLYLAFFGPLLARTLPHGSAGAWQVFVPGILVQVGLYGAAFVGFAIIADWRNGSLERMRVTPVSRTALLLGRVFRDVVVLVVQATVLVLAAVPFGLRAPVAGVALALCFVAALGFSLSALSYTAALLTKSEDSFAPLLNMVTAPLMLLSGLLLPMASAPSWLNLISRATPLRYLVEAMRELFAGRLLSAVVVQGLAVAVAMAVFSAWAGARVFQRDAA